VKVKPLPPPTEKVAGVTAYQKYAYTNKPNKKGGAGAGNNQHPLKKRERR